MREPEIGRVSRPASQFVCSWTWCWLFIKTGSRVWAWAAFDGS